MKDEDEDLVTEEEVDADFGDDHEKDGEGEYERKSKMDIRMESKLTNDK